MQPPHLRENLSILLFSFFFNIVISATNAPFISFRHKQDKKLPPSRNYTTWEIGRINLYQSLSTAHTDHVWETGLIVKKFPKRIVMWKIRVEKRNNVNENCIRILILKFNQNVVFSQEKKISYYKFENGCSKKKWVAKGKIISLFET